MTTTLPGNVPGSGPTDELSGLDRGGHGPGSGNPSGPTGWRHVLRRALRPLRRHPGSRRQALVGVGLVVLLLVLLVASIMVGEYVLPAGDVVRTLLGAGDPADRFVVLGLRAPRAATAIVVGFALGAAGAITQSVARNPLASPDILGVTAGATAAAVAAIVLAGTGAMSGFLVTAGLPVVAVLGGLVATALVCLLAWRGGIEGYRLVLVGLGVNAGASAITSWMLVRAELPDLNAALIWMTGSLNRASFEIAGPVAVVVVVTVVVSALSTRWLAILRFDSRVIVGLGVRRSAAQLLQIVLAVVLAAAATAAAGPVPFVAFVAPQIAWRALAAQGPPPLGAGLVGACVVLAADLGARSLPVDLPVGVVTSAVGAPFLLWLLLRESREVR
ncbi:iron chelate uptake ABC transporter family permease subunit [Oerskovia sp. KBS0722]|uniref:FecCD family ABC transporter permease n=1 Tax=Oerskovia sp. KBS0722 TaxID=1179673 RepID=UPI00110DDF26|nr:iron chelate uptake ABC transporter family permease subunit [Oerskovia sp. KBS0722]QDW61149.1 iron ABC transporter permease [Oerskovia sp. KBS0722]